MSEQDSKEAIPRDEYFKILSDMPVVCVDTLPYRIREGRVELLLVRRAQEPAKNCLYPVGKGLKKNNFSLDWALQVVLKEMQMKSRVVRAFGFYEVIYSVGQSQDVKNGLHNPCVTYLVLLNSSEVKIDSASSGYRWVTKKEIESGLKLPPYTQQLIEDSEIFSRKPEELEKKGEFHHRFLDYRGIDFMKFEADL